METQGINIILGVESKHKGETRATLPPSAMKCLGLDKVNLLDRQHLDLDLDLAVRNSSNVSRTSASSRLTFATESQIAPTAKTRRTASSIPACT